MSLVKKKPPSITKYFEMKINISYDYFYYTLVDIILFLLKATWNVTDVLVEQLIDWNKFPIVHAIENVKRLPIKNMDVYYWQRTSHHIWKRNEIERFFCLISERARLKLKPKYLRGSIWRTLIGFVIRELCECMCVCVCVSLNHYLLNECGSIRFFLFNIQWVCI